MRKLLLKFHRWVGIVLALLLLAIGGTGCLLVFEGEIDAALNPKLFRVEPQGTRLTLAEIGDSVRSRYPGWSVDSFVLPQHPYESMAVGVAAPSGKDQRLIYANPYTGVILGDSTQQNEFMGKVHQFHTHLLAGSVGEAVVGFSAFALLLLGISGIILWWPRKIRAPRSGARGMLFNFDLHNAIGFYSSVAMVLFAVTGLCIQFDQPLRKWAMQTSHVQLPRPPKVAPHAADAAPLAPDQLLESARKAFPGAAATRMVLGNEKVPAVVFIKDLADHTPAGRSRVAVDPFSGNVLGRFDVMTLPARVKFTMMWNREMHTGDIFGWPTRILAFIFSLMLPALAITGPVLWWQKRRLLKPSRRERYEAMQAAAD